MFERQINLQIKKLNEKKLLAAGLLSDRFPEVSHVAIHMQYLKEPLNRVFLKRTVNFFPFSYAYFDMRCLTKHPCNSGFMFNNKVSSLIKALKKTGKGSLICQCKSGPYNPGNVTLAYEISIKYNGL